MDLITEEALIKVFEKLKSIALSESAPELEYKDFHEEMGPLVDVINNIASSFAELNALADNLSEGKLGEVKLSKTNYLSGHFKELHSKLRHLTWQAKQIQEGNYDQRLEYFGDLSSSVNAMVEQLSERESQLKTQIEIVEQKSETFQTLISALETLLDQVGEKIFVADTATRSFLYMNQTAKEQATELCYTDKCKLMDQLKLDKRELSMSASEYYCEHSGKWFSYFSNPITWTGEVQSMLIITKDISDMKEMQSLERIAYYDTATNAFNRRYALDTLERLFEEKAPFSVCFIDLDMLKGVNDNFGHAIGDEYIMTVYNAISQSVRKDDCVCRLGGDEFLAILIGATSAIAERVANKVNTILTQINEKKEHPYTCSVSVGIASSDYEEFDTVDKILEAADARMYESKKRKKVHRTA